MTDGNAKKKIKVTVEQAVKAIAALDAIDAGRINIVKEGGVDKIVYTPMKISFNTSLTLAENRIALMPIVQAFDKSKRAKMIEILGADIDAAEKPTSKMLDLQRQTEEIQGTETDVSIRILTPEDLRTEENGISPGLLSSLIFMLKIDR